MAKAGLWEQIRSYVGRSMYSPALDHAKAMGIGIRDLDGIRKPLGGHIAPQTTISLQYYPSDIEPALQNAAQGQFGPLARMARAALTDSIVQGSLSSKVNGILRLPTRFRGDPEMVADLEAGRDSVTPIWQMMVPPSEALAMLTDGDMLGYAVGELVQVEGRDFPVLSWLPPENLVYIRSFDLYCYRSQEGLIPIQPGDGRWVLYAPGGRTDCWKGGLAPSICRSWINKLHAQAYSALYCGSLAHPAKVATSAPGASQEQRDFFFNAISGWGSNNTFELSPGWSMSLLEASGRGYQIFQDEITRADKEIQVGINGQTVSTDGGAGFVSGDLWSRVRTDLILGTARNWEYCLNTQVFPWFAAYRYGVESIDSAPCIAYDTTEPADLNSQAQSLTATATAINTLSEALANSEYELDVKEILDRFGVPVNARKKVSKLISLPSRGVIQNA